MTLSDRYNEIKRDYISLFEQKHNIKFVRWINDDNLSLFEDSLICLSYSDIRFDIDNDISKDYALDYSDLTNRQIIGIIPTYVDFCLNNKKVRQLLSES